MHDIALLAAKSGMLCLLAAAAPFGDTPSLWAQWGLAGAVVGYVLWRDNDREKRMSQSIAADHQWIRETLLSALERNTVGMDKVFDKLDKEICKNGCNDTSNP